MKETLMKIIGEDAIRVVCVVGSVCRMMSENSVTQTVTESVGMAEWGLCTLCHGIQNSMEAILACHPALSTE